MTKTIFCAVVLLVAEPFSARAATPVAVNPYTFLGRVMDARHVAFDANRTAKLEAADASGKTLARATTFFRADSRRNYSLAVPMSTVAVDGSVVQGTAIEISVTDDLGKIWRGVVMDAAVGTSGGVREVDIVLGEDKDGDGIDDTLYAQLAAKWEASDYLVQGETFDPEKDYDGDGVSTIAEALSGTNPFDPADVLRITAFTYSGGSHVQAADATASLSFQGVAGHAYVVEKASDLRKKDWKACEFRLDASGEPVNVISCPSGFEGVSPCTVYLLPSSTTNAFFRVHAE